MPRSFETTYGDANGVATGLNPCELEKNRVGNGLHPETGQRPKRDFGRSSLRKSSKNLEPSASLRLLRAKARAPFDLGNAPPALHEMRG